MVDASPRLPLLLGLSGGIGSGKSTVAGMLAEQFDVALADADGISRALTGAGGAAVNAIAARFGPEYVDAQGAMDRARMRARVFGEPEARQALEAILHPMIGRAIDQQVAAARDAGRGAVLLDIPLLVESPHWRPRLHHVLIVDCPAPLQVERVMQRSGLARAQVEAIMASQASRVQRLRAADTVVFNGQVPLADLRQRVWQAARFLGLAERV